MSLLPDLALTFSPPILSPTTSFLACGFFTASYVGGLYLSASARVNATVSRDHPTVILARLKIASWSSLICLLLTGYLVKDAAPSQMAFINLIRLLGLPLATPCFLSWSLIATSPPLTPFLLTTLRTALLPLLLTAALYTGPLYVSFLDRELPFQTTFSFQRDVLNKFTTLYGVRNYLIGPLTEEIVFRSCVLSCMFFSSSSLSSMIFLSPLWFGVAHVHHAWSTYISNGRTSESLKRGVIQALLQFGYTSVFGWYASFLFLRSGTILAPFVAHVFCNIMGLPNPLAAAEYHKKKSLCEHHTPL